MIVNRKAWHFRLYSWFNEGRLPHFIDLCSYVRTVIFWTPLKAIFYSPSAWMYGKNKLFFYSTVLILIGAIATVLAFTTYPQIAPLFFIYATVITVAFTKRLSKIVASDWREAKDTKFGQYVDKTDRVIETGLKYLVGLPLKTIFWTIWSRMYDFHKALFWSVIVILVGAMWWGFFLSGVWWKVLAVIGALLLFIIVCVGIGLLIDGIKNRGIDTDNNIAWQFLKAKKKKICPFIELRD